MYLVTLTILLLGVVTFTSGVWLTGSFSHGEPSFGQGCYCHNNGIAIYVNGTGDGNGGTFLGSFNAGTSFHLYVSTNNVAATGVVPGLQEWMSNQTDNAKFTIAPAQVTDGSAQDKSPTVGNITTLYKISIPASLATGSYTLTLYAQGSLMQPLMIQVTGTSTTTSTTSSSHSTTSTTSTTSSSKTTTSSSTTSITSSTTSSTSTTSTSSTTSATSSTHSSTSTTSTTSTTPTSSTSTTATTTTIGLAITSPAPGTSLVGDQAYTISGTIYPAPTLPDNVSITVQLMGSSTMMDSSTLAVTASGTFSYTTHVGQPHSWTSGPYLITAIDSYGMKTTMKFEYSASVTTATSTSTTTTAAPITTQTSTQTVTTAVPTTVTQTMTTTLSPSAATTTQTKTVTGATSTVTNTQTVTGPASTVTNTSTSTVTQTTSTIPSWAYGVMLVLLILGLAFGYVVKNLVPNRPAVRDGVANRSGILPERTWC